MKTLPLESYLKKNLELGSNSMIVDYSFMEVSVINESIKTVIIKKEEPVQKEKNAPEYEQLSLFSFIDDED